MNKGTEGAKVLRLRLSLSLADSFERIIETLDDALYISVIR